MPTVNTGQTPPTRVVGVWNWDIQHNLVYCGAEFAEYYGVDASRASRGEPIENFLAAIHPDDVTRVSSAIHDAIATGAGFSQLYRLATRSLGERLVRATGRSHRDMTGRPAFFTGLVADIAGLEGDLSVDLLSEFSLLRTRAMALKSHPISYLFQALQDEIKRLSERGE